MQQKQYDGPPSKFVNAKRVKLGQDSKGRDTTTVTFGTIVGQDGTEVNTLDILINALLELQGKQANLTIHVEEKTSSNGSKFPSAFVRVTEMIPRAQGGGPGGQARYVPKGQAAQDRAASIRQNFNKG